MSATIQDSRRRKQFQAKALVREAQCTVIPDTVSDSELIQVVIAALSSATGKAIKLGHIDHAVQYARAPEAAQTLFERERHQQLQFGF